MIILCRREGREGELKSDAGSGTTDGDEAAEEERLRESKGTWT